VTDGDDLAEQILEAEAFVEANLGILERLRDWPGVDEPVLDFGYNSRIGKGTNGQRTAIACDRFEAIFLLKLGRLGLGGSSLPCTQVIPELEPPLLQTPTVGLRCCSPNATGTHHAQIQPHPIEIPTKPQKVTINKVIGRSGKWARVGDSRNRTAGVRTWARKGV
jgi:hypothetical protein